MCTKAPTLNVILSAGKVTKAKGRLGGGGPNPLDQAVL